MELYDYNLDGLKTVWKDEVPRQHAQLVIMQAIGNASDISVAQANAILAELDELLLDKKEDDTRKGDPAL
jgi:ATP/maltotriose-dependent transcriptional regulator MalT